MEFKNKTELLDFEKQRENFISKEMVEIHRNSFSCYWQMLKYLFNKKNIETYQNYIIIIQVVFTGKKME